MKLIVLLGLTLSLGLYAGCAKQNLDSTGSAPASPMASVSVSQTAVPVVTESPSSELLLDPIMPAEAEHLVPLPAYTEADGERYDWWTKSGVSENRLRVMASSLEPAALEEKLRPFLAEDERVSLLAPEDAVEVADSRLALFSSGMRNIGVLISPMGQPPAAWTVLDVPPVDWAASQEILADKKSLVVFASGYGMAEQLQSKLAEGATATPVKPSP